MFTVRNERSSTIDLLQTPFSDVARVAANAIAKWMSSAELQQEGRAYIFKDGSQHGTVIYTPPRPYHYTGDPT